MIYFIQQGKTKLVKIGYTDSYETLEDRIKLLQTGNPYELKVIGTVAGDTHTEKLLHALFHDNRERGEWFKLTSAQIYTLSQFECKLERIFNQSQVIDFTKDESFMKIHNTLINKVHGS